MYQVSFQSKRVLKDLDALGTEDYERVAGAIDGLAGEARPSGCVQLDPGIFRIRVGQLRVIYQVDDAAQTVVIGAVRRRNEATYRSVGDLFR